jgi:hypothetical protein
LRDLVIPTGVYEEPPEGPRFDFYRDDQEEGAEPHYEPLWQLCAHEFMTFLIIAIPFMMLTISIAAVPLLVLTAREHRMRSIEVQAHGTPVRP